MVDGEDEDDGEEDNCSRHPSSVIRHLFQLDCHFRVHARAEDPGVVLLAVLHFRPHQELAARLDQRLDEHDLAGERLLLSAGQRHRDLTGRPWISEGR